MVVTDTSPINYLILIGYVDVLPVLHGDVVIPQAVARELRDPRTPELVRQWIALLLHGIRSSVPKGLPILPLPTWEMANAKRFCCVRNSALTRC